MYRIIHKRGASVSIFLKWLLIGLFILAVIVVVSWIILVIQIIKFVSIYTIKHKNKMIARKYDRRKE